MPLPPPLWQTSASGAAFTDLSQRGSVRQARRTRRELRRVVGDARRSARLSHPRRNRPSPSRHGSCDGPVTRVVGGARECLPCGPSNARGGRRHTSRSNIAASTTTSTRERAMTDTRAGCRSGTRALSIARSSRPSPGALIRAGRGTTSRAPRRVSAPPIRTAAARAPQARAPARRRQRRRRHRAREPPATRARPRARPARRRGTKSYGTMKPWERIPSSAPPKAGRVVALHGYAQASPLRRRLDGVSGLGEVRGRSRGEVGTAHHEPEDARRVTASGHDRRRRRRDRLRRAPDRLDALRRAPP